VKRTAFFLYGVVGHLGFLATYAILAAFVGNLVPAVSMDSRSSSGSLPLAVAVNLGLILLFGLQHSVMARPAFKAVWTKIIPPPVERSTYVVVSCFVTLLLIWQWRSIDVEMWDVRNSAGRVLLQGLFLVGWVMVPVVSLMINHFDLFGTRQVWLHLRGREYEPLPFRTPSLYGRIRHPLYVGWTIAFWATPTMTLGHLLFAVGMTAYMLIAVIFEERDLIAHFGHQYREYSRRVPMFVPRLADRYSPLPEADTVTEVGLSNSIKVPLTTAKAGLPRGASLVAAPPAVDGITFSPSGRAGFHSADPGDRKTAG